MYFEIIGEITDIEIIAVGDSIKDLERLQKRYGPGRWRKLKESPWCGLRMARYVRLRSIGMKPMALAKSG